MTAAPPPWRRFPRPGRNGRNRRSEPATRGARAGQTTAGNSQRDQGTQTTGDTRNPGDTRNSRHARATRTGQATRTRRRSGARALADWRTRLRAAHATTVLRWLRAGVLAMVALTALLHLVVATEASRQLAAAHRTEQAVRDIDNASLEAGLADDALTRAFQTGQVALMGTGTDFANHAARVNTDVTSAVGGNAAGTPGLTEIQFVAGQLTTAQQEAGTAVLQASRGGPADRSVAHDALTAPRIQVNGHLVPGTGGLIASLDDLHTLELNALHHQRRSPWLVAGYRWPLLVGPVLVMLGLVIATGRVLATHFRRHPSRRLTAALLTTAGVAVTAAVLGGLDTGRPAAQPRAGHPVTLALALALLTGAAVLAYLAYRPRLAEYRFPP